jgi:hypothetical protein
MLLNILLAVFLVFFQNPVLVAEKDPRKGK